MTLGLKLACEKYSGKRPMYAGFVLLAFVIISGSYYINVTVCLITKPYTCTSLF